MPMSGVTSFLAHLHSQLFPHPEALLRTTLHDPIVKQCSLQQYRPNSKADAKDLLQG